ncbi:MAG: MarR family winged helix-turn-helix transcriptional regulator [Dehalococcoidia bacterium]
MATTRDAPSNAEVAAWRSFITAYSRLTDVLERELQAERDMPLTWYDVLVVLQEAPGQQLRMHDLAEQVLLSRAGLTRLVDRMTTAGLVERIPCPEDRRGTYVRITNSGRKANLEAAPVHLGGVREHFTRHLSAKELSAMRTAFDRVVEGLK